MTYLLVEAGRWQIADDSTPRIRDELGEPECLGASSNPTCLILRLLAELEPSYLGFLVKILAKLRWDDSPGLPVPKVSFL
jgi:hypothetical protein